MKKLKVLLLSGSLFLTSCVTYQKCVNKFGTAKDTVLVPVMLKTALPADTNRLKVTRTQLEIMLVGSSLRTKNASGLSTTLTKKSQEEFECAGQTETKILEKEVLVPCPPVQHFEPKPQVQIIYKTPFWNWVLIIVLALALVLKTALRVYRFLKQIILDLPEFPRP